MSTKIKIRLKEKVDELFEVNHAKLELIEILRSIKDDPAELIRGSPLESPSPPCEEGTRTSESKYNTREFIYVYTGKQRV